VDILWCQGAQNIGLSNHKLKSALTITHLMITNHNARPSQTDERNGNSATIRSNVSRAKKHFQQCPSYRPWTQRASFWRTEEARLIVSLYRGYMWNKIILK